MKKLFTMFMIILLISGCNGVKYDKETPIFIYDSLSMELIRNVPSADELFMHEKVTKLIPLYDTMLVLCSRNDITGIDTMIGIDRKSVV